MVSPAKLRLVDKERIFPSEVLIWDSSGDASSHTLHNSIIYPGRTRPEFASYFINELSRKEDVVLDPFCGAGTVALEAALAGRIPWIVDRDPFALALASAKLQPADITQVTLFLQRLNLSQPINSSGFYQAFSEFYDIDTYREIFNLRKVLLSSYERTARFVELITLGLMHGNNAGYFSVYTNPQFSLTLEEQKQLNIQRRQKPEYRPIVPRILKRVALVTSDGIPSVLERMADESKIKVADARNMQFLSSESVDLIVTAPPVPYENWGASQSWLRLWFSDINSSDYSSQLYSENELDAWVGFMNESLMECARVLRSGHRIVLYLKDLSVSGSEFNLAEFLKKHIDESLGMFMHAEAVITNKSSGVQLKDAIKARSGSSRSLAERILIIRKK
jgi:DNA modification methylase